MPSLLLPPPPLSLLPLFTACPSCSPFLAMAAHGRPARCVLSCPALPLPQAPLPVLRSAPPAPPCRSCPGMAPALPGSPSCPSRQIDKRQAPAPCGMPAACSCSSISPAPSPPSCLPGPSALSFPPAALPLPPRCGRCASLCPSLQTDRQGGGRLRPAGCPPPCPARPSLPLRLCLSRSALPGAPPAPPVRQTHGRLARSGARPAASCCPHCTSRARCCPSRSAGPVTRTARHRMPLPSGMGEEDAAAVSTVRIVCIT
jgi:hypothetical protein